MGKRDNFGFAISDFLNYFPQNSLKTADFWTETIFVFEHSFLRKSALSAGDYSDPKSIITNP
jgi:hypothetical protein